jgi:hypothetical protein
MISLDPYEQARYRRETHGGVTTAGITMPMHTCSCCKKRKPNMRKRAGTGSSRHNPIQWICQPCEGAENAGA